MDKKYILLDLDGTITNSEEGILNCVNFALESLNYPKLPHETLMKFIGPPLIDAFMEYAGMSKEDAEKALKKYRERYPVKGIYECYVYDGVRETLKSIQESGRKCILATAKPLDFSLKIIEHFGLLPYFDATFGADFEGIISKKHQVIAEALKSIPKDEHNLAVMVGDREQDISGAKQNGITSVGVRYGFAEKGELENAGADYIVDTPRELAKLITE